MCQVVTETTDCTIWVAGYGYGCVESIVSKLKRMTIIDNCVFPVLFQRFLVSGLRVLTSQKKPSGIKLVLCTRGSLTA